MTAAVTATAPVGTEADYLTGIVEAAEWSGWLVHHCRPARTADGHWKTHIQGHIGFPDLVLIHGTARKILFVEVKAERGRLSKAQTRWRDQIKLVGSGLWQLVVVPSQYDSFVQWLADVVAYDGVVEA